MSKRVAQAPAAGAFGQCQCGSVEHEFAGPLVGWRLVAGKPTFTQVGGVLRCARCGRSYGVGANGSFAIGTAQAPNGPPGAQADEVIRPPRLPVPLARPDV